MIHPTTRVMCADLRQHIGQTATVSGWIQALRLQQKVQFLIVRDHSGFVQVTHRRGGPLDGVLDELTRETAVRITGDVVANSIVNLHGLEIVPKSLEVLARADTPLPIDDKTSLERRLDWRFLDVRRRPAAQLLFAVQTTLEQGLREYAYASGCTEMHTPKLMDAASESGSEVFEVGYFDRTAYLAQSPQLYKQMAIAAGIDRVFEVGPVFRAEPSFTTRHATEFTGVDVELAWTHDVEEVIAFQEQMLSHALAKVVDLHADAVSEQFGVEMTVPPLPFPRISMAEALALVRTSGRDDLDPEGERTVGANIKAETGHEFVFVTEYPAGVRPFYHMRQEDRPELTQSFDLLWNGIEISTGAQREHRYDVLHAQMLEKGVAPESMEDYLNCFRFGCPPHGGFGMGLSRMLMVLLGLSSIRESTFLFRGPNRLTP